MPRGIPHSVFLGRIVRPGRDPQWTEGDREYALAWTLNDRAACSGCGTRADEWDGDEDAYISDHMLCEGCARLAQEKAANLDRSPDGQPLPGQHVYLVPRELHEQRQLRPQPPVPALPDD